MIYGAHFVNQKSKIIDRIILLFSQNRFLQHIGHEASQMGYTAYVVGGMVRDAFLHNDDSRLVLNTESDVDIVLTCAEATGNITGNVTGNAIDFAHFMQRTYGGQVTTHQRFRTATWLLENQARAAVAQQLGISIDELPTNIDLITARKEVYSEPAVLPTVQPSHIEDDLSRRDFTINTLAVCLHPVQWNQLLDLHHGVDDLQAGLVRVLHDQSFVDDPTRLFRAVRYEQRFGFQMDGETLGCLQAALEIGMISHLTPARVRHEFERIFHEERPEESLHRLADLGVLTSIHPKLQMDKQTAQAFVRLRKHVDAPSIFQKILVAQPQAFLYWSLWIYRLDQTTRAKLQERFLWPKDAHLFSDGLAELSQKLDLLRLPDLRPSQVVVLLEKADETIWSLAAQLWADEPIIIDRLTCYATEWRHVRSQLRGGDLHSLNVPRGPAYAQILRGLRYARLDGKIASREDEIAWVHSFLAAESSAAS